MATAKEDPSTTSGDYKAMFEYWQKVGDLFKGAQAVREAQERYLPRFENETRKQYNDRVKWARYTNVYRDIVSSLSDKPFSEEVTLVDSPTKYQPLVEDIDGQGNNLHNFASDYFETAVNNGIDWIYVDYTRVNTDVTDPNGTVRRMSVAEERATGARPYWVRVSALEMIAVYTMVVNSVEEFVHCRMLEVTTEREGYEERTVKRIRELNREPVFDDLGNIVGLRPATWVLWEEGKEGWFIRDPGGELAIGIIPIVPLVIGKRIGMTWRIEGAMNDCADLQIDLYQQEATLQNARLLTGFPMLSADGVDPEMETVRLDDGTTIERPKPAPVGPRAVLYGGRNAEGQGGSWKYIEITASSLAFLASQIKETIQELRELGRQPLTAQTGNLTTITTAFAAQKGNSAVQSWALTLKDALELAFKYTAMWMGDSDGPSVYVFTDFDEGIGADDGFADVLTMRKGGDLSQETLWEEAQRRKRLGDEFTVERERKRLEEEGMEPPDDQDVTDSLGEEDDDVDPSISDDPPEGARR